MTPAGHGMHLFPAGKLEQELRAERKRQIREARKHRERVVVEGKRYWLVRLPDEFQRAEPVRTVEPRRKRISQVLG